MGRRLSFAFRLRSLPDIVGRRATGTFNKSGKACAMCRTRILLLSCLGCLAVLLAGALTVPPSQAPFVPPRPDLDANRTLDRAVAALNAERPHWLRISLWQQGNLSALTYQAEGVYLSGPDHRLRLD